MTRINKGILELCRQIEEEVIMEEPIRVAQVLNKLDNGGIEAIVENYYFALDKQKIQFDFYFTEESRVPNREKLKKCGARLFTLPPYTHIGEYQQALMEAFHNYRYTIVHVHLNTMSVFALFAAWHAKVPIRICHNHTSANWTERKRTLLKYFLRPWNRVFATHLFACNEYAGRWMYGNRCVDSDKVVLISNAIDTGKYAYDSAARSTLRRQLGIPQQAFVIGHVGRFVSQKNHSFLIDIFADLYWKRNDAWLLLVGDGPLQDTIMKKIDDLGIASRVCYVGARRDVDKLYSAMDCFCLPSLYEGMPVVAIEAQANGLPFVGSDNISQEIKLTPLVNQLSLGNTSEWVRFLEKAKRNNNIKLPDAYNIHLAAKMLETHYLALLAQTL